MSLPAQKKAEIISFTDLSGGVNLNDPAISLRNNEVANALNVRFDASGFGRHGGAENLTTKDDCDDYLDGLFTHCEVDGTKHLYTAFGNKLYEVNTTTGELTELFSIGGTGECWGGSHFGTFYMANGASVVKVEGSTASRVGIAPPSGVTATGYTSGGSLPDGVYKIYACYARKVSGLNILYSKGQLVANVTISGGGGNGHVRLENFANSSDGQVNNKVAFMTDADDSTYYQYGETDDNSTLLIDIVDDSNKQNAITYSAYAANNNLPENFEYLLAFDNRIWGVVGNVLYYSLKSAPNATYNLERFPALNKIEYPYQITGLFTIGKHLCINTACHGVIIQPEADINARYEHIEQKESFKYMRSVADWRGGKIGLTHDKLGFFSPVTLKFEEWDYGVNIRPVLNKIWTTSSENFQPCGITVRRPDRIEYLLSFRDTSVNEVCNNRTWVLNLSGTEFLSRKQFVAPWECVGRGFNYVAADCENNLYFGQSFDGSSTIYTEDDQNTTHVGIYDDDGAYIDSSENMAMSLLTRVINKNLFTKTSIENIRGLYTIKDSITIDIFIADNQSRNSFQTVTVEDAAMSQSLWGSMIWGEDNWASEGDQQDEIKVDDGVFGYTWYLKIAQSANDKDLSVRQIDVLTLLETGRGI